MSKANCLPLVRSYNMATIASKPGCFASAAAFSCDSHVCKCCDSFADCSIAVVKTLNSIRSEINVEEVLRRHGCAAKKAFSTADGFVLEQHGGMWMARGFGVTLYLTSENIASKAAEQIEQGVNPFEPTGESKIAKLFKLAAGRLIDFGSFNTEDIKSDAMSCGMSNGQADFMPNVVVELLKEIKVVKEEGLKFVKR